MTTNPLDSDTVDVLVADDEPAARDLVESILEIGGWKSPVLACDGREALQILETATFDVLITDLDMPRLSGDELIPRALELQPDLTVLVMTGFGTIDRAVDLMKKGVYDFLCKPFEVEKFLVSLERARERVLSLSEVRGIREVVAALMAALESKDQYLNGHSSRVAHYAVGLGKHLGFDRRQIKTLEYAAVLHDVGKIGIHEDILNKPGALTDEEFEEIKKHPIYGRDILAPVSFLKPCLPAVLHHHERIDGRGYPEGLQGDDIPVLARAISVVDSFDAMNSQRSYRQALPATKILGILEEVAGTQLDATMCRIFLENFEDITGISTRAGVQSG
ncbi:MAG: response regulator [Planctomycetes bacterium]|nr:response regulator [Planctomycetota bacterium]